MSRERAPSWSTLPPLPPLGEQYAELATPPPSPSQCPEVCPLPSPLLRPLPYGDHGPFWPDEFYYDDPWYALEGPIDARWPRQVDSDATAQDLGHDAADEAQVDASLQVFKPVSQPSKPAPKRTKASPRTKAESEREIRRLLMPGLDLDPSSYLPVHLEEDQGEEDYPRPKRRRGQGSRGGLQGKKRRVAGGSTTSAAAASAPSQAAPAAAAAAGAVAAARAPPARSPRPQVQETNRLKNEPSGSGPSPAGSPRALQR